MRWLLLGAIVSCGSLANSTGSYSDSYSSSSAYNQNTQVNPVFGGASAPRFVVGKDFDSCEATTASIGVIGQQTRNSGFNDNSQFMIGASIQIGDPFGIEGFKKRCLDAQHARLLNRRFQTDDRIIGICTALKRDSIRLDARDFPWFSKCLSMFDYNPRAEAALLVAKGEIETLKSQKAFLRERLHETLEVVRQK